jgi:hypothetical protein
MSRVATLLESLLAVGSIDLSVAIRLASRSDAGRL